MASGNNYGITGGLASNASDPRYASGTSNSAISENEQLSNFISMITRDETPFMSKIGKTKAKGVYHEWQTDELTAPRNSRLKVGADFDNVRPDGETGGADNDDTSAVTVPNRTRLGTYTQINGKTVAVSNTKRAVDQAGVSDEYAYQLKKRGTEMRRDMEQDIIHSLNISSSTSGAVAGSTASVWSFINNSSTVLAATDGTNDGQFTISTTAADFNTGTNNFTTETGSATVTRGELELDDIDTVMQNIYEEGGKAGRLMTSPKNRRVFSQKSQASNGGNDSGASTVRRNIDDSGKLTQAVSIYMSDFGEIMIEPNYIMGLSNAATGVSSGTDTAIDMQDAMALIYDPSWFKMATLRPMQEVDVGQRGDSTVGMFVEEWALEVSNPQGCGAIINIGA